MRARLFTVPICLLLASGAPGAYGQSAPPDCADTSTGGLAQCHAERADAAARDLDQLVATIERGIRAGTFDDAGDDRTRTRWAKDLSRVHAHWWTVIRDDCAMIAREMGGGSGGGPMIQICRLNHITARTRALRDRYPLPR